MGVTAWTIVWYKVSGIQKQNTKEVSSSKYWGHTILADSSILTVASELLKEIFMTLLANPAKMTQRLKMKKPAPR